MCVDRYETYLSEGRERNKTLCAENKQNKRLVRNKTMFLVCVLPTFKKKTRVQRLRQKGLCFCQIEGQKPKKSKETYDTTQRTNKYRQRLQTARERAQSAVDLRKREKKTIRRLRSTHSASLTRPAFLHYSVLSREMFSSRLGAKNHFNSPLSLAFLEH